MKPVSTGIVRPPNRARTVFECPPTLSACSYIVMSCRRLISHAADRPDIPVPTTAILRRVFLARPLISDTQSKQRSAHNLKRSARYFGSLQIDLIGIVVRINLYVRFLRNPGPFQGISFLIPRGEGPPSLY